MESDLIIERMSVPEIKSVIVDLNDKNQMLENHLKVMKKCFRIVVNFKSFLENICHKLDKYVTEDELKQLSDFREQLADIYQGQIPAHILMDALNESSADCSVSEEVPKSDGNTTQDNSSDPPLYVCSKNDCFDVFKNKADLKTHEDRYKHSIKDTTVSCDSTEVISLLPKRVSDSNGEKEKKKPLKNRTKINSKTTTSSQTPYSSTLISSEPKLKSLKSEMSGQKPFLCYDPKCDYRGSSLTDFYEHRKSSHSDNDCEDRTQKKNMTNDELIVSHNTELDDDFGWIDGNSDSFNKCSDNSCGQLFSENSHLLRHIETRHSSEFLNCEREESFQPKCEPVLLNEDLFEIEELDASNSLLSIDRFVVQIPQSSNSTAKDCTVEDRPFIEMSLNSSAVQENQVLLNSNNIQKSSQSVFSCTELLCDITFEDINDLIIHLKAVHNIRVKKCTFNGCPFLYGNRNELWKHLKECHKGQQMPFKCSHPSCSNAFLTEADLNRHTTSFHAIDRYSNISGIFISDTLSNCQSVKRKKPCAD